MLLNNDHFDVGLCNGSIGFVTQVDITYQTVTVAFQVIRNNSPSIVSMTFKRQTKSFIVDGAPASRTQFPLQNSFALTVHKSQSLTLPSIDISLDRNLFTYGHAYTAVSRATRWSDVYITDLDPAAFKVDPEVIREYNRLEECSNLPLPF
jgi:ATP-dependent exoDNAse (exonuclease V) alpha subunit